MQSPSEAVWAGSQVGDSRYIWTEITGHRQAKGVEPPPVFGQVNPGG